MKKIVKEIKELGLKTAKKEEELLNKVKQQLEKLLARSDRVILRTYYDESDRVISLEIDVHFGAGNWLKRMFKFQHEFLEFLNKQGIRYKIEHYYDSEKECHLRLNL